MIGRFVAFEPADAGVGVHADDEQVALALGELEVLHVPEVDEVEAAVGEDDAFAGGAVAGELWQKLLERAAACRDARVLSSSSSCMISCGRDRHAAEAFDLEPAGDVRERDRFAPARAGGRATHSAASTMSPAPVTSATCAGACAAIALAPSVVARYAPVLSSVMTTASSSSCSSSCSAAGWYCCRLSRRQARRPLGFRAIELQAGRAGVFGIVGDVGRVDDHRHVLRRGRA